MRTPPLALLPLLPLLLLLSSCAPWYIRSTVLESRATGSAPTALETLTRVLEHPETGMTVRLVGVIHFGSPEYYRELEARLRAAPLVLYEQVGAPADAAAADWALASRLHLSYLNTLLGTVRQGAAMAAVYGPDGLTSTDPRWRRADLDLDDLIAAYREIGVDLAEAWGFDRRIQEVLSRVLDLRAVTSRSILRDLAIRDLLAELSHRPADAGDWLGDSWEILIERRNDVVLDEIGRLLTAGEVRGVSVFYGAGHMPDLEERLGACFGFEVREAQDSWQTAAVLAAPTQVQIEAQVTGMLASLDWSVVSMRELLRNDRRVLQEMRAAAARVQADLDRATPAVQERHGERLRGLRDWIELMLGLVEGAIPAGEREPCPAAARTGTTLLGPVSSARRAPRSEFRAGPRV